MFTLKRVSVAALLLCVVLGQPGWAQFDVFGDAPRSGLFDRPIRRYTRVLYDFLNPTLPYAPLGRLAMDAAGEGASLLPPADPLRDPLPAMRPLAEVATQIALGDAQAAGETRPAICLHPEGVRPAEVIFPAVTIPPVRGRWPRVFLLVQAALADPLVEGGLPSEDAAPEDAEANEEIVAEADRAATTVPAAEPDPAPEAEPVPLSLRFTVTVNDIPIYARTVTEGPWEWLTVDLTEYAGQVVSVVMGAANPNPEAVGDPVLCLGDPMLLEEQGPYYLAPGGRGMPFGFSMARFRRGISGIAFVHLRSSGPATAELVVGDASRQVTVEEGGDTWHAVPFQEAGRFSFTPLSGAPQLLRLDLAPFEPPVRDEPFLGESALEGGPGEDDDPASL